MLQEIKTNQQVLKDFIEGAPKWFKAMLSISQIVDGSEFTFCYNCGISKERVQQLIVAIKELQEKAWKYDQLSK